MSLNSNKPSSLNKIKQKQLNIQVNFQQKLQNLSKETKSKERIKDISKGKSPTNIKKSNINEENLYNASIQQNSKNDYIFNDYIDNQQNYQQQSYQKSNRQNLSAKINVSSLLQSQLGKSQKGLKFTQKRLIDDKLTSIQTQIYAAESSKKPTTYLKQIYRNLQPQNEYLKDNLDKTIQNAVYNIQNQIKYQPKNKIYKASPVPKTKDDLKQLEKIDKYRLLKIKQGQVKSKVGNLRHEMQKQYFMNKNNFTIDTSNMVQKDYYSLDHPQTQKAQNLIRKIKQKRQQQKSKIKQILSKKQLQKQQKQSLQKQYEQQLRLQRKQQLKQLYQQKYQQRQLKRQQLKKKQEQFNGWIKLYQRQKPLQQKLQQEMVIKYIIPQIQNRHKTLLRIKNQNKPIDIDDIKQHQKRYLDFKKDQNIRKKAQNQMKIQKDQQNIQQIYQLYKGKYRYIALQSMYEQKNQIDPKQIQKSKKIRQLAYSDQIRYYQKEKKMKQKFNEIQDTRALIRRVRKGNGSLSVDLRNQNNQQSIVNHQNEQNQNQILSKRQKIKKTSQTLDVYAEGIKNLKYVKNHIRERLANGYQKKPKIQFIEIRQTNNTLQQLRQQRVIKSLNPSPQKFLKKHSKFIDDDLKKSNISLNKKQNKPSTLLEIQNLKVKSQQIDQRIKRNQQKNKHIKDIQKQHEQQEKIEVDLLKVINNKLKMVNQLK